MKDSIYTICYAIGVGALCAGLLTGAAQYTKPYYEANKRAEEMRNVLAVLEVPVEPGTSIEELAGLFESHVESEKLGDMTVYKLLGDGSSGKSGLVAVEIRGPGLWAPIGGFVSLESDWNTIRGITFHEQEETPGLGAEIAGQPFCSQFQGKQLLNDKDEPALTIVNSGAEGPLQVDGISGATITCNRVQDILHGLAEQVSEKGLSEEQQ